MFVLSIATFTFPFTFTVFYSDNDIAIFEIQPSCDTENSESSLVD